jgi:hypothetical protein
VQRWLRQPTLLVVVVVEPSCLPVLSKPRNLQRNRALPHCSQRVVNSHPSRNQGLEMLQIRLPSDIDAVETWGCWRGWQTATNKGLLLLVSFYDVWMGLLCWLQLFRRLGWASGGLDG